MEILRKNIAGVLLFVALIAAAVSYPRWKESSSRSDELAAAEAARHGAAWLLNFEGKFTDPGILWIVEVINDAYCRNQSLYKFTADRFSREFSQHPFEYAYERLLDKSFTTHSIDYTSLDKRVLFFDDMLIPALYCDVYPIPDRMLTKITDVQTVSDYTLTHKFLAILFLKEFSCFGESLSKADALLGKAAQKMASEQKSSSFSDLFAERTAFLLHGGFGELVPHAWITAIIDAQSESGAWGSPPLFGEEPNPHTTALSVWALAEYTKTCPF